MERGVEGLAVTPDSRLLVTAGPDGVRLWRLPSGEPAGTFADYERGIRSLAVTPDGQLLVTAGSDGVRLWRLPSGEPAGTLTGHEWVTCMAVTPDGRMLITAGSGETVWLWPMWSSLLHKPIGQLALGDVEGLSLSGDLRAIERPWVELLTALVRHRHRHDVEIADTAAVVEAGECDIELDG